MTGKFLERDGRRVRLSTLTLPAPKFFPYTEFTEPRHRTMAEVMEAEQNVSEAVQKWAESVTFACDCAMQVAALGSVASTPREPDQTPVEEAPANGR